MSQRRINDLLFVKDQTIVVVDDDSVILEMLSLTLRNSFKSCEFKFFTDVNQDFWNFVQKRTVNLFILDLNLPSANAIEVTKKILKLKRGCLFLFISGSPFNEEDFKDLVGYCLFDYMSKPLDLDRLVSTIVSLLNISVSYQVATKQDNEKFQDIREHYNQLIKRDRLMINTFKEEIFKNRFELEKLFCSPES